MRFNRFKIQPNTTNGPYKNKLFFFILPFFHIFFKWNSVLHVTNSIQNQMLNSREFPNILSSAFNPNQGAPPTTRHTPCLLWPHPLKLRNVNRCIEKNNNKNKRRKKINNKQTTGETTTWSGTNWNHESWQEQPYPTRVEENKTAW